MIDYTPTCILTWNPKRFNWIEYDFLCNSGPFMCDWSCRRKVKEGDRFVLLMQGMGSKNGIIGYGEIVHFYELTTYNPFGTRFVDIRFERLVDYRKDDYVKTKDLKEAFPEQCFTPQLSGIRVRASILPDMWGMIRKVM